MDERGLDFTARQQLVEMSYAFITDERAFAGFAGRARSVRRSADNVGDLAARLSAERAT